MGAALVCRSFPASSTGDLSKAVDVRISRAGYEQGHCHSGDWGEKTGVRISQQEFFDADMASDYIGENAPKSDDQLLAVKVFKANTKALNSVIKQYQRVQQKIFDADSDLNMNFYQQLLKRVKGQKSKFKQCGTCSSRIAISYLKSPICPVCSDREFLFTASDHKKRAALVTKRQKLSSELKDLEKKRETASQAAAKKANDWYWLVGGKCRE